ncbi:MAG: hypothetical protein A2X50_17010 [Candidatus Rokubacteria bacterium GWF2_70_14]|nr:MAG: hypothetical protein A2X53_02385 [Candidatus Rokubacteria bacterium GWA2_70_23]OGK91685.1 MAG: hypothetical protein A2X50_17010 [Candidatus Rokubacteria bacterium GWF2_70_14]
MWQALYEELKELGFVVITVALDRGPEDARPWIEAARPTHPSLIDVGHAVADLYNMVNVPTVVWIDERGRIVRPNDVAFGTDTFRHITGIEAARHLGALRAWVRGEAQPKASRADMEIPRAERGGEAPVMAAREVRALQPVPSQADQQARAEFGLGRWLAERGRGEAAERHFVRAGELAPHDFTIRRGTMPIRGIDPMGPAFRAMLEEWVGAGKSYYRPLPD